MSPPPLTTAPPLRIPKPRPSPPEGRFYYHHNETHRSLWQRPGAPLPSYYEGRESETSDSDNYKTADTAEGEGEEDTAQFLRPPKLTRELTPSSSATLHSPRAQVS